MKKKNPKKKSTPATSQQMLDRISKLFAAGDFKKLYEYIDKLWRDGIREREVVEKILTLSIDGRLIERSEEILDYCEQNYPLDAMYYLCRSRLASLKCDNDGTIRYAQLGLQLENIPSNYKILLYNTLGHVYRTMGRTDEALEFNLKVTEVFDPEEENDSYLKYFMDQARRENYSNYLFASHAQEISREEMFDRILGCRKFFDNIPQFDHPRTDELKRSYESGRKLRIGYASPDFRFHVTAFFAYCMLKSFDDKRFEIIGYSNCKPNNVSGEFSESVNIWRNVVDQKPKNVANLIHEDQIDILFELAGHSANNMLLELAHKPAPIQMCGISWFNSTGLDCVDYFLADHYTDPVGFNDRFFTEKLLRMRYSHFCYMWHDKPQPVLPAPFTQTGYITFGSFNQFPKIRDDVLRAWKKIMDAVPNSRLMLKCEALNSEYGRNLAREKLTRFGFDLERAEFSEHEAAYLEKYQQMDIALDTYPYPGGGTTCDAIYMGVPVITLVGQRHNARFGYSLLMNMDLPELCAKSWEDYVQKAIDLANDPERLKFYHQTLRRRMTQSPVMSDTVYMGDLESKYEQIYFDWLYQTQDEKDQAIKNIDANIEKILEKIIPNQDHLETIPEIRDEFIRLAGRRLSLPNPPMKLLLLISKAYLSIKTKLPEKCRYNPGDTARGIVYKKRIIYLMSSLLNINPRSKRQRDQGRISMNSEFRFDEETGMFIPIDDPKHDPLHAVPVPLNFLSQVDESIFSMDEYAEIYLAFADALSQTNFYAESDEAIQTCRDFILKAELDGKVFDRSFLWRYSYLFAEICVKNGFPSDAMDRYREASNLADDPEKKIALLQASSSIVECLPMSSEELLKFHTNSSYLFDGIKQFPQREIDTKKKRKSRIGYMSASFKENITFNYIYGILVTRSKNEFEAYAYSFLPKDSEDMFTAALKNNVDKFLCVDGMSSEEIAKKIHDDKIDILFDLTGNEVPRHEAGMNGVSSLSILARKPAPIQIANFISTTGLEAVDFFLTDSIVDPPGSHDDLFAEQLIYMPCYLCYAGRDDLEPSIIPPFKKNGYITFGCFHRYIKITDQMLLAWKQIIERVPNSRLVIKCPEFISSSLQDSAYDRCKELGFDMNQVAIEDPSVQYMERYSELDIALDVFPYSGGGVACDAIYMGVPIITLRNERRSSRFASSILHAIGFGELITESVEDYIDRAVGIASDPDLIEILHQTLRQKLLDTVAIQSQNYNHTLEDYYRVMLSEFRHELMGLTE
ncbi:MAG: hypothetical protein IJ575_04895 [Selenomonadaceae bacterium]|nr:hypothetical protein [Selenomonadaceae bacterium]